MIIGASARNGPKNKPYVRLVKLIIKAQLLNNKVVNSGGASLAAIAKRDLD